MTYGERWGIRGADDPTELLGGLARKDYAGSRATTPRTDLWEFGWFAPRGMVREGTITHVAIGNPHSSISAADRQISHESSEQRELMVIDGLMGAIAAFLDHLKANHWRPKRGTDMATYFIGTCTGGFWRTYDKCTKIRVRELVLLGNLRLETPGRCRASDEIRLFRLRESLHQLLEATSVEEHIIWTDIIRDLSQAKISQILGISAGAGCAGAYASSLNRVPSRLYLKTGVRQVTPAFVMRVRPTATLMGVTA